MLSSMGDKAASGRRTTPLDSADFAELVRRVRMVGGSRAEGSCVMTVFSIGAHANMKVPSDNQAISASRQDGVRTVGCGLQRRLLIPYEPPAAGGADSRNVTVCADDDAVALWPRFAGRREESRAPSL